MNQKLLLLIDQLKSAKALAEKDTRRHVLVHLLELAKGDAEEEANDAIQETCIMTKIPFESE